MPTTRRCVKCNRALSPNRTTQPCPRCVAEAKADSRAHLRRLKRTHGKTHRGNARTRRHAHRVAVAAERRVLADAPKKRRRR